MRMRLQFRKSCAKPAQSRKRALAHGKILIQIMGLREIGGTNERLESLVPGGRSVFQ
jgi:hypothetical protein